MFAAVLCASCIRVSAQDTLPEVVVTATGTEHLLKNAPVQTEVISRKMLDAYGGKSIEDIMGGLTASFAFNEGDMGSQMQLGGLGNNYILILIDGKRIHGDNGGENDLGLIDPANIERIEIVKGAQSALYGSDAMAGVINIITKKREKDALMVENTTRYGGGGGMAYDLRQHNGVGYGNGKWQSYTNFQLQMCSGWQNTTQEYAEGQLFDDSKNKTVNKFRNWQIAQRFTYNPVKNLELYAYGAYYTKDILRPHDKQRASLVQNGYDLMYRNAGASVGGKWKINAEDFLTFDLDWNMHDYFYNYVETVFDDFMYEGEIIHHFPFMPGDRNLQSDQQRAMASLKGVFNLPAYNTLSAGLEYRYDYLHAPLRVLNERASDWTGAVYVQDEYNQLHWLNITAGVRLNANPAFGFKAAPKLSTMFLLGDFRIRAGWSQGFKTPTPKELYYSYIRQMGSVTYYYMGNPNLKAQSSNYFSTDVEYRGKKFNVSLTGYYNKLDNMITLVTVSLKDIPVGMIEYLGDGSNAIIPRKYMNMESARTYGADLNMNWNITDNWSVGGNYSYLDTDAWVYNEKKDKLDHVIIDGMAHHKWNAYGSWSGRINPVYKLSAGIYTRGSSTRYYQDNGNGKPFQIWKLATSHDYTPSKSLVAYHFEFGVDNIFNYVDRTPRPYHLGTTACGTNVYIAVNIKFLQGKKINTHIKSIKNHDED